MIPTLIRIPEEEHALYKELSREKGVSLAEFLRRAARKEAGISRRKKGKGKYSVWNLGIKVVTSKEPRDGSVNHDKYYNEFEEKKIRDQHK